MAMSCSQTLMVQIILRISELCVQVRGQRSVAPPADSGASAAAASFRTQTCRM